MLTFLISAAVPVTIHEAPISNIDRTTLIYYYVVILGMILTGIGVGYKFLSKLIKSIIKKYMYLENTLKHLDFISNEFIPNHGTSIKDKIDSMQKELSNNTIMTKQIFYRQRWTLNNQHSPIFETDIYGDFVWINTSYLKLVKRDISFVLGKGWYNIIDPSERDRVIKHWNECIHDGTTYEDTFNVIDNEGKRIKVFCSAMKTEGTGFIGTFKILSEIPNYTY